MYPGEMYPGRMYPGGMYPGGMYPARDCRHFNLQWYPSSIRNRPIILRISIEPVNCILHTDSLKSKHEYSANAERIDRFVLSSLVIVAENSFKIARNGKPGCQFVVYLSI